MFPFFVIAGLATGVYIEVKLKIRRMKGRMTEVIS